MLSEAGRKPKEVYFVDSRILMPKPFVAYGIVCEFDEEHSEFTVMVYHDDRRKFKVRDFDKTIFFTREKAKAFVDKLPTAGQKVYTVQKSWMKVLEETVGYYDIPKVYFKSGASMYVYELGEVFFLKKEEALAALETLKNKED